MSLLQRFTNLDVPLQDILVMLRSSILCLFRPLLLFKLGLTDNGPLDGAVTEHIRPIPRRYTKRVEPPIEFLQHSFALHRRPNARRRAVNNVNGRADADLVAFAERQQRFEARRFHPADHVGGG